MSKPDGGQVGELWRHRFDAEGAEDDRITNLIRKLVEERAKNNLSFEQALRDFHIDPATWKTE